MLSKKDMEKVALYFASRDKSVIEGVKLNATLTTIIDEFDKIAPVEKEPVATTRNIEQQVSRNFNRVWDYASTVGGTVYREVKSKINRRG